MESDQLYANIGLAAPKGDVLCAAIPEPANYADRPWFQAALGTKQFVFGGYVFGRVTRRPLAALALPILNERGEVEAVLYAGIDLKWLERYLARIYLPAEGALFVADSMGLVLASVGWPEDIVGQPCPLTLLGHPMPGSAELLSASGPGGKAWVYVAVPFASGPEGMAHVIMALPSAVAYAPARRAFLFGTLLVVLLGLGAAALALFWAPMFVQEPMGKLVAMANRLGVGDLSARTGLPHGRTEFGRLAQALDQAAQNLKDLEEKRRALEHSLAQLVQVSPVVLYTFRPEDLMPLWVSPNVREILGYTPEEALQPNWWQENVHPEDRDAAMIKPEDLAKKGWIAHEYRFRLRNGTWIWVHDELRLVRDEEGRPLTIVGAWTNITELKEAEAKLGEQLRILQALYKGARELVIPGEPARVAREICRTCVEVFGLSLAWVGMAEEDGTVRVLAQFPEKHPYPSAIRVRWDESPEGQGPTGRAFREGRSQVTQDIFTDPHYAAWRSLAEMHGFRSSAAFPFMREGKAFATLNLYSSQPNFFTPEKLELFQALANLAAGALENARLLALLERRLREIQALRHIDLAITGSLDPRITLRVLLEEVTQQLGVDAAAVFLMEPSGTVLRCAAARGGSEVRRSSREWSSPFPQALLGKRYWSGG